MHDGTDAPYGRDAILMHLRDVLELETMSCLFEARLQLLQTRPARAPEIPAPDAGTGDATADRFVRGLVIAVACCAFLPLVTLTLAGLLGVLEDRNGVSVRFALVIAVMAAVALAIRTVRSRRARRRAQEVKAAHRELAERFEKLAASQRRFLDRARRDTREALGQCYDLGIVPHDYRDYEALQRLLSVMAESTVTLSQALAQVPPTRGTPTPPLDDVEGLEAWAYGLERQIDFGLGFDKMRLADAGVDGDEAVDALVAIDLVTLASQAPPSRRTAAARAHARAIRTRDEQMRAYHEFDW